jgi:FHS family L-fucose permease-like MFS transporter
MAIVGNACVPQFTAYIMHQNEHIYQIAYIIPMVCFAVCAYYGYKYKSLLQKDIQLQK